MTTTVLLAGATGMLGNRIAAHLLDQPDVSLRLLLRASARAVADKAQTVDAVVARGAVVATGDVTDPASLDAATTGVDVVVSALQGGPDIMVDGQVALAQAAARNGARRFLPSDYAIDLFAAPRGAPQLDMRRRAAAAIDALPMQVVHVLNGAFMDMMLDPSAPGLVDVAGGSVTLWGTGGERFDLTTVDDTARFTARVGTDPADLSGVHYLSGEQASFNTIIAETEQITGRTLTRNVLGSADDLRRIVAAAEDPWSVVMQWYFLMLTTPPFPTNDNDRYPDARPTGLRDYLTGPTPPSRAREPPTPASPGSGNREVAPRGRCEPSPVEWRGVGAPVVRATRGGSGRGGVAVPRARDQLSHWSPEGALGGLRPGGTAARPAQHVRGRDRCHAARERSGEVDPRVGETPADQSGAEAARRVHRCPADRAGPQSGEHHVGADADSGQRTDVLRGRRRPEDGADQTEGQQRLDDECLSAGEAGTRHRPARSPAAREGQAQQPAGEHGPGDLRQQVARHASPPEVTPEREGEADHRVEMRSGDRAHEEDDGEHGQAWRGDAGRPSDHAVRACVDGAGSGAGQHEQEGADQLAEQSSPLVPQVIEVPRARQLAARGRGVGGAQPAASTAWATSSSVGLCDCSIRCPTPSRTATGRSTASTATSAASAT